MQAPGIQLKKLGTDIKVEWRQLLFGLGEVMIYGFSAVTAAGAGAPDAIAAALKAMSALNLDEPVESRAYALTALSFATALDKLSSSTSQALSAEAAKEISIAIGDAIETEIHVLKPGFLFAPTSLSLYQATRPMLIEALKLVRPSQESSVEIGAKLDAAFSAAVYQVISLRREYFQPILHSLDNPALSAATREYDWNRYRVKLKCKFAVDPIFGQESSKTSLSQLYIPCRCNWNKRSDSSGEISENTAELPELIRSWVDEDDEGDAIRLIFGGPGSGKSSFAKALAAELAEEERFRPIFVELQKLGSFADLQRAIARRLVDEEESFSFDPLESKEDHRRFILIFDGLDELVLPGGDAATRVAESFSAALGALLRVLNAPGKCRAKAIVTGRTAIAQVFQTAVLSTSPEACLEIRGFIGHADDQRYDLRPLWWKKYAAAFSLDDATPQAYYAPELNSITSEPLLCYLLAISGYALSGWEDVADNHNKIYDKLLGEVWERKWGKASKTSVGRVGPTLSLDDRSDFDALMESMALAAWWAGENRVATKDSFEKALILANASEAWTKFRRDEGDAMGNLALTFYFRKSETDAQGIEFTHKSFSEYLVSRFLVRSLVGKISFSLHSGALEYREALDRWTRTATGSLISEDMKAFLFNECKLTGVEHLQISKKQVEFMLARISSIGLPVQQFSEGIIEQWEKNCTGQINLLHMYQEIHRALVASGQEIEGDGVLWPSLREKTNFIRRSAELYVDRRSANLDFSNLEFEDIFLNGVFLAYSKFENCRMHKANFHCASLSRSSFKSCVLTASTFSQADLNGVNFSGADLRGADFSGANIREAVLPANWLNSLDPRTFENPPVGKPILEDDSGTLLAPDHDNYPDLAMMYEERRIFYSDSDHEFVHETFYGKYPNG